MKVFILNCIENVEWLRMKDIYYLVGWMNYDEEKIKKIF